MKTDEEICYIFEDDRSINGFKDQFISEDEFVNLLLSGHFVLLHSVDPETKVERKVWVNRNVKHEVKPYTQA